MLARLLLLSLLCVGVSSWVSLSQADTIDSQSPGIPSDQLNPKQLSSAQKDFGPKVTADIQQLFSSDTVSDANELNAKLNPILASNLSSCRSFPEQDMIPGCIQNIYSEAYLIALSNGSIDDVILQLLRQALKDGKSAVSISSYRSSAQGLAATRKAALNGSPDAMSPSLTERKLYPEKAGDLDHLSPRERLYLIYNPIQIRDLSDILAQTLKVMDAKKADISIQPRDGSTPIDVDLSEGEIFRLAIALMKRNLQQDQESGLLKGTQPKMLDLIAAGEETGVVSGSLIEDVLQIPQLNDPKSSFLKKTAAILEQVGQIALASNPATELYGIIGFMFVDAFQEAHKANAVGEHDDIF